MKRSGARQLQRVIFAVLVGLSAWVPAASAELVLKLLVVNPSETDVKEFDIKSPLPPEVKPEHVLDSDGLKVDYDSQAGIYILVGRVTLKPKESITKQVVLEDVWVIPADRFVSLRRETDEILRKLDRTPYQERGGMLGKAIERRLAQVQDSQNQPFASPMQHITQYRENLKALDAVETDLVSLRQLMVMAALSPATPSPATVPAAGTDAGTHGDEKETGGLSVLATWRLIFIILGMLGFVSVSFFLVWQRQLKLQLAKQAAADAAASGAATGNGSHAVDAGSILRLPTTPSTPEAPSKP